jgi:hypothetical protein
MDALNSNHVLDFPEMLSEETALLVRASQGKRAVVQSDREIVDRQQEVLAKAPVFSELLERQGTDWLQAALKRSHSRKLESQRDITTKISSALRSQRYHK